MSRICVLLSTYNGEKYLEEQLESIVSQNDVEVDILVRDDGSTDNTRQILDKWKQMGNLEWYQGGNLGFAKSFLDLVKKAADYDYYAFCDQDDIWLSDKLKRASSALDSIKDPIKLYCSNVYYYRGGQTYGAIHKAVPYFDKYTCLLRNIAPGCTMVFSRELKELLASASPRKIIAHDFWIFQLAVLLGQVHYDYEPTMLYRQHENNQIGQKVSRRDIWKRRVKNIRSENCKHEREEEVRALLDCYSDHFTSETKTIIAKVADYRQSFANKMRLITDKRYTMGTAKADFYLMLRLLFSKF